MVEYNRENENKRLETLLSYDIKYTIEDPELNDLTKLASIISQKPIALLSLLDAQTSWVKSSIGLDIKQIDRSISLCNLAIYENDIFEIKDLHSEERLKGNIVVAEMGLRYFAGIPLRSPNGYNIGVLCIIDYQPGALTECQKSGLNIIADQIMRLLEFNKKSKHFELLQEKIICKTKAKEEFLNNISHELRTPLNAIYGFAQLLSKSELNNEQRENINIIKSSVENLISIINDILDFSKLESGKLKIERYPFNIRETVNQVQSLLIKKAEEKGKSEIVRKLSDVPVKQSGGAGRAIPTQEQGQNQWEALDGIFGG